MILVGANMLASIKARCTLNVRKYHLLGGDLTCMTKCGQYSICSATDYPLRRTGLSKSEIAGSFVRPTRPHDKPRSFFEALRNKYAPETLSGSGQFELRVEHQPIEISGKLVEEVGFDRIWKQLSVLEDLKIVLLDTLCLRAVSLDLEPLAVAQAQQDLSRACPKIQELDLSRNLLETWDDVAEICRPLKHLRVLNVGYGSLLHPACRILTTLARIVSEGYSGDQLLQSNLLSTMSKSYTWMEC